VPDERGTGPDKQPDEEFVPRGAIAFMILMILTYGAIWLFFFFLMVGRA
jgi:hypothetical protein